MKQASCLRDPILGGFPRLDIWLARLAAGTPLGLANRECMHSRIA